MLDCEPADWLCEELLDELELLDDWLDDWLDERLDGCEGWPLDCRELELCEPLVDGVGIDGGLGMLDGDGTGVGSDGVGMDDELRQPVPITRQPTAMNVSRVSVRLARMLASS